MQIYIDERIPFTTGRHMTNDHSIPNSMDPSAYLAAIIASSDDAIIGKDLNGNIMSWNPAATRIFGYTAEEAVGRHISLIIPPDKLAEEDYIIGEVRRGNRVDHFETVRRRKDGRFVNISVTVSPIRGPDGVIIGASKVARDVTQEREAQRTGAYLGAIIESSDDAIIGKDLNGFITSWNKSAERIFGYTAAEVVGRHITIIIPAERLPEEDKILTTLKTGNRVDHFETMRRHKDGHLVPVSLTVSPIRDGAGNIIGASKVSRDISDRIQAEEKLKEASRKKDDFLANISHELRTPMNAVVGISSLLKHVEGMPPKAVKFIDTLSTSADNLLELINDLLDFAKIEADSFTLETVEFSLAAQVEKNVAVAGVRAREKNLALHVSSAPQLNRHFMGDPLRLGQVLTNLLSNAIKFTAKGAVSLDISGDVPAVENAAGLPVMLTFKVADTGAGIAEDKLGAIFEKFTQADSSITRRYGGTGLGLAITKACVEKMGGSIGVESQVGIGTTFIVRIPFVPTAKVPANEGLASSSAPLPKLAHKHVLLVEDYEPNILVTGETLESLGFSYEVARNGFEAIRMFAYGQYDVILMDIQMHEMDGLEATRRIRAFETEKQRARTPVIAMTAHVREQDKDKCLAAGMDDFIPKPFDYAALSTKLNDYVRVRK